jgi:hypothetical protein
MIPFPNIYWWSCVLPAQKVMVDTEEHFEKMSFRNRYMLASDKGPLTLSIPIKEGRQQRKPMKEVLIDNDSNWQIQHWRSIKSAYNRSPYFQYFESELQQIFTTKYEHLIAFSQDSINLSMQLLGRKLHLDTVSIYQKEYDPSQLDIRRHFRSNQYNTLTSSYPKYHQVFEDRMDFLPNLSMLDLLFAEGKNAVSYLAILP